MRITLKANIGGPSMRGVPQLRKLIRMKMSQKVCGKKFGENFGDQS